MRCCGVCMSHRRKTCCRRDKSPSNRPVYRTKHKKSATKWGIWWRFYGMPFLRGGIIAMLNRAASREPDRGMRRGRRHYIEIFIVDTVILIAALVAIGLAVLSISLVYERRKLRPLHAREEMQVDEWNQLFFGPAAPSAFTLKVFEALEASFNIPYRKFRPNDRFEVELNTSIAGLDSHLDEFEIRLDEILTEHHLEWPPQLSTCRDLKTFAMLIQALDTQRSPTESQCRA